MDPDVYQMKDIKRRLTSSERYNARLEAKLDRLRASIERRFAKLEADFNLVDLPPK